MCNRRIKFYFFKCDKLKNILKNVKINLYLFLICNNFAIHRICRKVKKLKGITC